MYEFDRSTPVTVALQAQAGDVTITAEERLTIEVEVTALDGGSGAAEQTVVTLDGDTLLIRVPGSDTWSWRRTPKLRIVAKVPAGSAFDGKSAAADVWAGGTWSTFRLGTASATIDVAEVQGDADLDSASGDVTVTRVGGALRAKNLSGRLRLGDVTGDANLRTASGAIEVRSAGASLRAESASGDIEIGELRRGQAALKTASGDIRVGVAAGTGVWMDLNTLSGRSASDLTPSGPASEGQQASLELRVRTLSGDIAVHRATGAPAAA